MKFSRVSKGPSSGRARERASDLLTVDGAMSRRPFLRRPLRNFSVNLFETRFCARRPPPVATGPARRRRYLAVKSTMCPLIISSDNMDHDSL